MFLSETRYGAYHESSICHEQAFHNICVRYFYSFTHQIQLCSLVEKACTAGLVEQDAICFLVFIQLLLIFCGLSFFQSQPLVSLDSGLQSFRLEIETTEKHGLIHIFRTHRRCKDFMPLVPNHSPQQDTIWHLSWLESMQFLQDSFSAFV